MARSCAKRLTSAGKEILPAVLPVHSLAIARRVRGRGDHMRWRSYRQPSGALAAHVQAQDQTWRSYSGVGYIEPVNQKRRPRDRRADRHWQELLSRRARRQTRLHPAAQGVSGLGLRL